MSVSKLTKDPLPLPWLGKRYASITHSSCGHLTMRSRRRLLNHRNNSERQEPGLGSIETFQICSDNGKEN